MKVQVIIGSTRQNRFGDKPANWIAEKLKGQESVEVEILDLRDYKLPFFDEPTSPNSSKEPFTNPEVVKWTKKIAEGDAYVIIAAEYNHGYTGVLKNALDYVYREWNNKPVAFVSYGGVAAGTRAVQQLKEVALELQMFPIRNNVHISLYWEQIDAAGNFPFEKYEKGAQGLVTQLIAFAKTFKNFRESK